jgi:hypothetical protein
MRERNDEQRGEREMADQLELKKSDCRRFLEAMELGPANDGSGHAEVCADCRAALEDLVATRKALEPMRAPVAEAGPWFATRVMAAIRTRENEQEERRNGVWLGIRRLAPRLVALCALVLVVGTTWAYQVRQGEVARRLQLSSGESIFESVPAPLNDDVMIGSGERP